MRHLVIGLFFFFSSISPHAQVSFSNISTSSGVELFGFYRGVSVGDYDGDGWEDLMLIGLNGANNLLRNEGNMTFSDQTELLGLQGDEDFGASLWADLDNDGDPDLVLGGRMEASRVFRNDAGTFTELTQASGLVVEGRVYSLNAADIDNDGWLDLYFAELNGRNTFLRNLGNWTFADETVLRNMTDDQVSMGAIFTDFDQDGAIDLYLTHDADQPNIMLKNNGAGYFTDVSLQTATNVAANGMGVDVADLDGDGWMDIYITNLYENNLLRNLSGAFFLDRSIASGTQDLGMGWGIAMLDVDLDGDQDIYVGNETNFNVGGIFYDNILYLNDGNLSFSVADPNGAWASSRGTYGVATADLDRDGDLDIILANSSTGCELLRNDTPTEGNWLSLELEGVTSARDAAGARVVLSSGDQQWADELHLGSSFASQTSKQLHFGLGSTAMLDEIKIYWPSGQIDSFENRATNQHYYLVEGESMVSSNQELEQEASYLVPNPASGWVTITSQEWLTQEYVQVSWLTIDGRLIARDRFNTSPGRISIPGQVTPGIYLVELSTPTKIYRQRLVVR